MSIAMRVAGALLGCAVCLPLAGAQQSPDTTHTDANKIYLNVVVTAKSGKPVAGLEKQDFTVLDNNVTLPITSFEATGGPQAPIQVVLLIDAVNTTFSNMAYERQQIDKFLQSNGGHLEHPISLALFTDTGVQIQQGASTDGNALSATLDKNETGLRQIHRGDQFAAQDLFDLSLTALRTLLSKEATLPGRKLIFWVSPGWPLLSGPHIYLSFKQEQNFFSEAVALSTVLQQKDITLYSIDSLGAGQNVATEFFYQEFLNGAKKTSQIELGDLSLQVLAAQSGGLALSSGNDLAAHLQQCMDDTTAYYRISYDAPPADQRDEYHRISIKLSKPGLTARAHTIYYAQPQSGLNR